MPQHCGLWVISMLDVAVALGFYKVGRTEWGRGGPKI